MYNKTQVQIIMEAILRRHTWMKDGTTYVGNGTYTLAQAQDMMVKDYPEIYKNID